MPTQLLILIFGVMYAFYFALVESFVLWGVIQLILPANLHVAYWILFTIFFIPNLVGWCIKIAQIFKDFDD